MLSSAEHGSRQLDEAGFIGRGHGLAEGVLAEVPVEGIECADEDDVGLPQFRVELAFVERVRLGNSAGSA